MIIFGTRGVTYNKEKGQFQCPECGPRRYAHKRVRRFFTLYFIPIVPLDLLGEYVECQACQGTYQPSVLSYDPGAEKQAFEAEFHRAIRRVMVAMMLADGVVDDDEIRAIRSVYEKMAGTTLSDADVQRDIQRVRNDRSDVEGVLAEFRGALNDAGKEMVIKAAYFVASADGDFSRDEQELLTRIANALEMSSAHAAGVIQEVSM